MFLNCQQRASVPIRLVFGMAAARKRAKGGRSHLQWNGNVLQFLPRHVPMANGPAEDGQAKPWHRNGVWRPALPQPARMSDDFDFEGLNVGLNDFFRPNP